MEPTTPDPTGDILSNVWDHQLDHGADEADLDADCSPTKVCRNAREFSFEGIAEEGGDLQSSWKQLLEREGKLSTDGGSVRDLILGPQSD